MGIIKKRPYVYLVSYTFKNGNGCKEYIESQNEIVDNVAIMSFTYIGRE